VPALIHSASCCSPRESYTLKFINEESIAIVSLVGKHGVAGLSHAEIVVAHGGGAIRTRWDGFRAWGERRGRGLRSEAAPLYYDTATIHRKRWIFSCEHSV